MSSVLRLDHYLVQNKEIESRTKAQHMIKDSLVHVDGKIITKPSFKVDFSSFVTITEHKSYVSRSAHKLLDFLDTLALDLENKTALDIGSSTGGFTQVLLEYDVKSVVCVDVGHDQLHHSLRNDPRVEVQEGCDIRKYETSNPFDIVVSDVAFISLHYILDDVDRVSAKDIILLFKPQFEVGREVKRDKNGVVVDKKAIENGMIRFEDVCKLKGWQLVKKAPSTLMGKDGNLEYCYYFTK